MFRTTVLIVAFATVGLAATADAQGRQSRRSRQDVARAQGVPPGQMPPANLCRVWYDDRSNGRQPSPISCREAEAIAAYDHHARVIYGENVYQAGYGGYGSRDERYGSRYPDPRGHRDDNRGVVRPGRNRDPRISGGVYGPYGNRDPYYERSRYTTPAFQTGYRDGLAKGREDADDNDRYDPNRHSWYRSATRGYENEYGSRGEYQTRYREGFEAGYAEGYRTYTRR